MQFSNNTLKRLCFFSVLEFSSSVKSTLLELILLTHSKSSRVDYCQGVELILHYSIYRNSSADQNRGLR
jgi:hypothetical protein